MKSRLGLAVMLLGVMLSGAVLAAEPVPLTIEDAIRRAFETNPAVKIAGYSLDAAQANVNASRMQRGITVQGNYSAARSGNRHSSTGYNYTTVYVQDVNGNTYPLSIPAGTYQTKGIGNKYTASVTASAPVYTGGALSGDLITKKAYLQQAMSGKQKAYNDLHHDVTAAYYDCLLTQSLQKVARESVETLEVHLQHVKDSFDVGVVAKIDVLRSEVELADARQGLTKAENNYHLAVHALNRIVGLPLATDLVLIDSLKYEPYDRDLESCLDFAATNRPELEQARQAVRASKGQVRIARSNFLPSVYGSASGSCNDSHFPGNENENWSIGLNVNWTVFDNGVTLSKVHAAEANTRSAKETLRDTEDGVMLSVRNNFYSMNEAEQRIRTAEVTVAKATEDYNIAQLRYANGVGTNTDVLDAQVALTQAKTNHIQACYDFCTSKIALDNAIGVPYKSPLEKKTIVKVKSSTKKKKK